ncbi:MAG: ABC transporter ATP-binding protein [Microthrixaceae bacterium]
MNETLDPNVVLDASITLRLGHLDLDVELRANPGEVLALLGPNGSGKTTTLRVLAGLEAIDDGRVVIGGQIVDDPTGNIFVRPEHRQVSMMFQDHLLFPHMNLIDNVAFGLRANGIDKVSARRRATEWLTRVGLAEHIRSRPNVVSGGQAQRAALARALITDPTLLLLDEPLSALDVGTRSSLRRDLRTHLEGFGGATLLVTHDPLDALALADHVAVIEDGRITQQGALGDVTRSPTTAYIAELMGTNLLRGTASGTSVLVERVDSPTGLPPEWASVVVAEIHNGPVIVLIRPNSITLHRNEPDSSQRNRFQGTVSGFDLLGDRVRVHIDAPVPLVAEVTDLAVEELGLVSGSTIWAAFKATDLTVIEL